MQDAIQTYINSVKLLCPNVDINSLRFLQSKLSVTTLRRKEFYIQIDSIQKNVGFVFSGLLRAFYVDNNGNEITIRFAKEHDFATEYGSFITRAPSRYYFQCIEPCVIVNISYLHMQESFSKYPSLEKYGRLIAEDVLKQQQKRIHSFLFENAEQRYQHFVKENPDLYNRVSLSYLSTYLGIERPSLSRIRKKIAEK